MSNGNGGLPAGNAVISQSGGPTVVINQSLVGCLRELRGIPRIERILGADSGPEGRT